MVERKVIKKTSGFGTDNINFAIVEFNGHTWVVGEINSDCIKLSGPPTYNFIHDPDCKCHRLTRIESE